MRYLSLPEANRLYINSNKVYITWRPVKQDVFRDFYLLLRKFERRLGDEVKDDFWRSLIRILRRYRFEACAAPLPFNHPFIFNDLLKQQLHKTVTDIPQTYPSFTQPFQELVDCINTLSQFAANPLMDAMEEIISDSRHYQSTALLLKEVRLIPPVEEIIQKNPMLKYVNLINTQHLKGGNCFDGIVIVGPTRWFPEYVLTAPRASKIDVICYKWVMDKWTPPPVFVESFNGIVERSKNNDNFLTDGVVFESDELLPEINWDEISSSYSNVAAPEDFEHEQETADAKLFLLEGESAVFLDESTRVLVIDLDEEEGENEDEETQVKRIQAIDIQAGIYILLRTSGGGEYIVPIADKILAKQSVKARESLQRWKRRLKEAVKTKGIQDVVRALKALGCSRASEVNVRNWMSTRSIKPRLYQDFEAIMKLVNLEDDKKEAWSFARAIDDAHKRAGFHIRKLLLKQVLSSDLTDLQKLGKMTFELDNEDGGTLTAFRVINISPEKYTVPLSRIGFPFERDGNSNG